MTTAAQVVNAINNAAGIPFQAQLDPLNTGTGQGVVATGVLARTQGGSGTTLDLTSGMQIVNDGQTYTVSLASCKTVEDVLNAINGSGAGVLAQINPAKTGLQVSSLLSGADFTIGENGGQTATQLGLRTFTVNTPLAEPQLRRRRPGIFRRRRQRHARQRFHHHPFRRLAIRRQCRRLDHRRPGDRPDQQPRADRCRPNWPPTATASN